MSIWRELFGSSPSGLERIRIQLLDMLTSDRHTFDLACTALLSHADVDTLAGRVRDSDHEVNQLVQDIRRQLVVHASTHGSLVDVPSLLLYMSIVKDVERIGDYAKNILDIAVAGGDLSGDADDRDQLTGYRDDVSELITDVRRTFDAQDADRATRLLTHWTDVARELDDHVSALIRLDIPAHQAVPRALYYRYLKRIVGHLMNILTALVMPLDKLDFFSQQDADT